MKKEMLKGRNLLLAGLLLAGVLFFGLLLGGLMLSVLDIKLFNKNQSPQVAGPASPPSFGFGRPASVKQILALDIDVMPDGTGLPIGKGTVPTGKLIYNAKCISCHGNGEKTDFPLPGGALFMDRPTAKTKTIGTYWPYATTIYDYVRRAMPYNSPGSLTDQEVYHITAYLLYENKIIPITGSVDQTSLPKIVMPAKRKYVNDDREGGHEVK